MPQFISGDTWPFTVVLLVGNTAFPVENSDTVTAKFVDIKTRAAITSNMTCLSTSPGANWAVGRISVVLSDANSALLTPYDNKKVMLCVQVERSGYGKKEWQSIYDVKRGYI